MSLSKTAIKEYNKINHKLKRQSIKNRFKDGKEALKNFCSQFQINKSEIIAAYPYNAVYLYLKTKEGFIFRTSKAGFNLIIELKCNCSVCEKKYFEKCNSLYILGKLLKENHFLCDECNDF